MAPETLRAILGCFLIWLAINYKRTPETIYGLFSKDWITQFVLVLAAVILIKLRF